MVSYKLKFEPVGKELPAGFFMVGAILEYSSTNKAASSNSVINALLFSIILPC